MKEILLGVGSSIKEVFTILRSGSLAIGEYIKQQLIT